jgi:hypothetical protein
MLLDVEEQNALTIMGNGKPVIKHTESDCWHVENVYRGVSFSMIPREGEPMFGLFRVSRRSFHLAGDRSLEPLNPGIKSSR